MTSETDLLQHLRTLAGLHSSGALTDAEFARAKERLLAMPINSPVGGGPGLDGAADRLSAALPGGISGPGRASAVDVLASARTAVAFSDRFSQGVLAGALLSLLAFFTMPHVSIPILGSLTGAGIASTSSRIPAAGWLWLVPIVGVTAVVCAVAQLFGLAPNLPRRILSATAAVVATLGVVVYLGVLIVVQAELSAAGASRLGMSAMSLVAAGYWIAMLGLLLAAVCAVLNTRPARPSS